MSADVPALRRSTRLRARELACPICYFKTVRSEKLRFPGDHGELTLHVCGSCGHAVRASAPSLDENYRVQEQVQAQGACSPPFPRRLLKWPHRHALVARQVESLAGRTGRVLDVGCGNGAWLAALGPGWTKCGVELSSTNARAARELAGADVFCGPFEEYLDEGRFDVISALALIEHITDPRAFIVRVRERLRSNGLFVLMTGDRESRTARAMGDAWPLYESPDHVSYFSAASIRHLLGEIGFRVVREEWRFMYFADRRIRRVRAGAEKLREILGMIKKPIHDHYYCYATLS